MFNITDDIIFIKADVELNNAIQKSFEQTITILTKDVKPNVNITSNRNSNLALVKFFSSYKSNSTFFDEKWLNEVFKRTYEGQDSVSNKQADTFNKYIPQDILIENTLTSTLYKHLKSNLRIFFYALWSNKAILLPLHYHYPRTSIGKKWSEPAMELYSEVLVLFRNCFMNKDKNYPDITKLLPKDENTHLRDYAYKVCIATNWYEIEDINIDEVFKFSQSLYEKRESENRKNELMLKPPLTAMLMTLLEYAPERCSFSSESVGNILHANKSLTASKLADEAKGYGKVAYAKYWINYQNIYLGKLEKRGVKNLKDTERALGLLNRYLFISIPAASSIDNIPKYPKDLSRKHSDGNEKLNIPSLIDSIIQDPNSASQVSNLKKIETFFKWLEKRSGDDEVLIGFKNIIDELDYPIGSSPRGTNKKIFPSSVFPVIHSLVYSLCEFYWYLIENNKYVPKSTLVSDCYDTESLGFVPIIYVDGKVLPLRHIPTRMTDQTIANKSGKSYSYPTFQGLFLIAVALETGLRHIHIRWLDRNKFISTNNRQSDYVQSLNVNIVESNESGFIEVSTDKVKRTPWSPYVSFRVINSLKRLKKFQDKLDNDVPKIWYDEHKNSPFGKIESLFCTLNSFDKKKLPFSYTSTVSQYKRIQLFYDTIININNIAVEPLNELPEKIKGIIHEKDTRAEKGLIKSKDLSIEKNILSSVFYTSNAYKSEYTPHGTRSTVASERVKILPPWVVAEYITGHESLAVLAHYVQVDPEYIRNLSKDSSQLLSSNGVIDSKLNTTIFKPTNVINTLRKVIDKDPSLIEKDFGGVSFSVEKYSKTSQGISVTGGISMLSNTPVSDLSCMTTHICPFNQKCPPDIIEEFGKYKCGQCYYSIKTVDNIPRILAEIRMLDVDVKDRRTHIKEASKAGAEKEALIKMEKHALAISSEQSAWIYTYSILDSNLKKLKEREATQPDSFLIGKPQMLKAHLKKLPEKDKEMNEFLLRIEDAGLFEEYFTPQLKSQIILIRNQILANNNRIDQLLNVPEGYDILQEFKGILRAVTEKLGITKTEALKRLSSPVKGIKEVRNSSEGYIND